MKSKDKTKRSKKNPSTKVSFHDKFSSKNSVGVKNQANVSEFREHNCRILNEINRSYIMFSNPFVIPTINCIPDIEKMKFYIHVSFSTFFKSSWTEKNAE